jgi:hypothetical protein
MNTVGVTVAIEELLLDSVTTTPPAGAGFPRLTGKPTPSPGATTTLDPRLTMLLVVAVMTSNAGVNPSALAVIVAGPLAIPLIVNDADWSN